MVTCHYDERLVRVVHCELKSDLDRLIECESVVDVCNSIVCVSCPVDLTGLDHHEETFLVVEDVDTFLYEILELELVICGIDCIFHSTIFLENRAYSIYLP